MNRKTTNIIVTLLAAVGFGGLAVWGAIAADTAPLAAVTTIGIPVLASAAQIGLQILQYRSAEGASS
ncbi:hypothetical protein [Streptomyces zaomyceticus]|uniref:hypothetical protein n=1 Tax=Streptomyces zaomyceticus TaxID=68286 RepID=UPI003249F291